MTEMVNVKKEDMCRLCLKRAENMEDEEREEFYVSGLCFECQEEILREEEKIAKGRRRNKDEF